jgi:hypothetical protein
MSHLDFLEQLPLWKGSAIVISGDYPFSTARRLAALVRRARSGKLPVRITSPAHQIDRKALNLIIPSYNKNLNGWLDRYEVFGLIRSIDAERFEFTNSLTGETAKFSFPRIAENAARVLKQFGF